jgi:SdrD B-like domain
MPLRNPCTVLFRLRVVRVVWVVCVVCVVCVVAASCGRSRSDIISPAPTPGAKGQIGDFVWNDADRDGVQDKGEPGIADVLVRLEVAGGKTITQTTNRDGRYLFTGLPAGDYTVTIDASTLPRGVVASPSDVGTDDEVDSDARPARVKLGTDARNVSIDFGFHSVASGEIGDFVWHDRNANGIQDPGEAGINGVVVVLRDRVGKELQRAMTGLGRMGRNGHYSFGLLGAGDYVVAIDAASLPPGFIASPCKVGRDGTVDNDCSPANVALAQDDTQDPTIDFGFHAPSCSGVIGDFVWTDTNGNGCQDAGERGLPGVVVYLSTRGRRIRQTTTDSDGLYEFAGLCAGTYAIELDGKTLPPCVKPSPCEACQDVTRDSNCVPAVVILPRDNSIDRTFDFGYRSDDKGGITGRVWNDVDNDGLQDPGEPSLTKVRVRLRDGGGAVICTVWTTLEGYEFAGLCAGDYVVEVDPKTLPAKFALSPCRVGNDRRIDNDCSPVRLRLDANQVETNIDIGYHRPATSGSIGDFVWNDFDRDGIQDVGEPGMKGIRVLLMDRQRKVLATQETDQFGAYVFGGLDAETYILEVDPRTCPPGYKMSPCRVGSDRSIDSDCSPVTVVLKQGQREFTIDFGFYNVCTLSIGDFVWHDVDGDGIQEVNEPGIESVRLILKNTFGTVLAKEFSDQDGRYRFERMCPGVYIVEIDPRTLPKGLVQSRCKSGKDPTKDNNCSPARVWLTTQSDHSIDFGFKRRSPPKGHQGCSSAFWKNAQNRQLWPTSPQTKFSAVFANAFGNKTLLEVLSLSGGDLAGLGRDAVAAYLNSESAKVRYSISTADIKGLFDRLYTGSKAERHALKKYFERLNNIGCPFH